MLTRNNHNVLGQPSFLSLYCFLSKIAHLSIITRYNFRSRMMKALLFLSFYKYTDKGQKSFKRLSKDPKDGSED